MTFYKNILPILLLIVSCSQVRNEKNQNLDKAYNNWEELIDSELTNWDIYLSYQHQPGLRSRQAALRACKFPSSGHGHGFAYTAVPDC